MSSVGRNELELRNFCVTKISGSKTDPGQLHKGLKKSSEVGGERRGEKKVSAPQRLGWYSCGWWGAGRRRMLRPTRRADRGFLYPSL